MAPEPGHQQSRDDQQCRLSPASSSKRTRPLSLRPWAIPEPDLWPAGGRCWTEYICMTRMSGFNRLGVYLAPACHLCGTCEALTRHLRGTCKSPAWHLLSPVTRSGMETACENFRGTCVQCLRETVGHKIRRWPVETGWDWQISLCQRGATGTSGRGSPPVEYQHGRRYLYRTCSSG